MLPAEPRQADLGGADLLVGGSHEDQVAARLEALPRKGSDRDRARRDLPLHVKRAAAPDLALAQLARPRIDLPLGGIGDDRVRVREQQEGRAVATARDARDEVRPLRHLRVQLALDPALGEVVAQELCGLSLVARRIDGVETDQLLEEPDNLVPERFSLRRWQAQSGGFAPATAPGSSAA